MTGHLIYVAIVLAGFVLWLVLFLAMRKRRDRKHDIAGYLLIGPLHAYLRRRNYSLTKRELFGWGAILILMLLVPWVTRLLER